MILQQKASRSLVAWVLAATMVLAQLLTVFPTPGDAWIGTVRSAVAAQEAQYSVFLPLLKNNNPYQTVFGASFVSSPNRGLEEMTAAGTTWVRGKSVLWSQVEPVKGVRDWTVLASLEQDLINAAQNGMNVILIIQGTPAWAQEKAGYECGPIKASELPSFASFMVELVTRYSKSPYFVKNWEIWNEPDVWGVPGDYGFGCWGDPEDEFFGGGAYGNLLAAIYPKIKQADPAARVIVGGLLLDCDPRPGNLCNTAEQAKPPRFLEGILNRNGLMHGGQYFDGVSFHAYDYYNKALGNYSNANWGTAWNTSGPVAIAKARFIREVLSAYGVTGKFLMNTESALLCDTTSVSNLEVGCEDTPASAYGQTKAYYLTQVYAAAIAENLEGNIWYSVFGWRNSSLLHADRSPTLAYESYKFAREKLGNAQVQSEITQFPGIAGFAFKRGALSIWVIWSRDGSLQAVNLGTTPKAVYDAAGFQLGSSALLNVGLVPLFIEW